jgi:two-component system, NarL family, invasion response regulator UvrY
MGNKLKCLIADDHPLIRKAIRDMLVQEKVFLSVVEADSGKVALAAIRREHWDLLVLDVALPDKHGLEVLKEAKLLRPAMPVLMLSLYPEGEFALRALKAGASGYLTKDRPPSELMTAVREVSAGRRFITGALANHMAASFSGGKMEVPHEMLSDREMEVLRLFGQGKNVSAIAGELSLSVKTISTYRARLLQKLGLQTTASLVRYAIEHRLEV